MQPQFELSPEPLLKPGVEHLARYGLNRSTFHLTQDWNGLRMGHYSSPHTFISFKLPILTDKSQHNIATTKIRKEVQKGNKLRELCWDEI